MGTHQATREGGKCRGEGQEVHSRDSRARISHNDRLRGSRADGAPRARRANIASSSISTGCCWRKSCRARARALAQNTPRGTARDSASGRESSRTRAASLARAASSIRARARRGAPSRRRRRRREEGPVRASRARSPPRRPVVTMTQSLAELEQLCNVLYNSHDPNERAHAENVLTPFSTNVEYIPQCKVRRSRRRLARDRSFARTRSAALALRAAARLAGGLPAVGIEGSGIGKRASALEGQASNEGVQAHSGMQREIRRCQ